MKRVDYKKLLERHYTTVKNVLENPEMTRLQYLGDCIFDFTTDDPNMSVFLAKKALEVCIVINNRSAFEYILEENNYKWYLVMCNFPFFSDKLEVGVSIRGAWWSHDITFGKLGSWIGEVQSEEPIKFNQEEWGSFIADMADFVQEGGNVIYQE